MAADQGLSKESLITNGLALDTGLCTMCGLCVALCPSSALTLVGAPLDPTIGITGHRSGCGLCYSICPGRKVPLRELDRFVFGMERADRIEEKLLGIMQSCYQGNATDPEIRASGASGGVVTALLAYALAHGLVSVATGVAFDKNEPWHARPVLARDRQQVIASANSKYVIVPMNAILTRSNIRGTGGQVGCVGLACHVQALRMLQWRYPGHYLSCKISFIIGVHCGSNWPMTEVELAVKGQLGVSSLEEVGRLTYRKGKSPEVCVEVAKRNGETGRMNKHSWHKSVSVARRCRLCLDWGAELSDVSVGDFFGPAAKSSDVHLGASTVIVRTDAGKRLVEGAVEAGCVALYPTPIEPVLRSAGLNSKKFGCASALEAFRKYGWPCPAYQYAVEPLRFPEPASLSSGLSIEKREQYWEQIGVIPLARQ
ncbi:MAG: Coenzyme F420 hydrogenase/dehydrogenase, beta subunit C-terminal domain [Chloroflexi bacterium]|nr:Coenzyme F420 hydrogenase/dehydrogenase, beta subunit C-terminal domain [Chloroflexota bacterium]